jgi:hypothetical protein
MQMDELTQQNAALVEQATAASQAMAEQVRGLNEMLARYRVVEGALMANTYIAAAPASGTAVSRADTPARAERRGANRPWAGKQTGSATAVADVSPARLAVARATGNGADTDWREF